jgi:hypothetical protein
MHILNVSINAQILKISAISCERSRLYKVENIYSKDTEKMTKL